MEAAKVQAQKYIDENAVGESAHRVSVVTGRILTSAGSTVVFSKSWCQYSRASKALLSSMGARFQVVELNQIRESAVARGYDCWLM